MAGSLVLRIPVILPTRLCRSRRFGACRAAWSSERSRGPAPGSRATATAKYRASKVESMGFDAASSSHKPTPLSPPPPAEDHISWTDKVGPAPAEREDLADTPRWDSLPELTLCPRLADLALAGCEREDLLQPVAQYAEDPGARAPALAARPLSCTELDLWVPMPRVRAPAAG